MRHSTATWLIGLVALACSSPQFDVEETEKDGFAGTGGGAWPDASAGGSSGSGGAGGGAGSSGNSGTAGATGTGGGSGCATTETCLPAVPSGWTGPVTIFQGSSAPACQGAWQLDSSLSANQDLNPGAEACSCSCVGDPGCGSTIAVTSSGTAGCGTFCDATFALGSTCHKLPTCSKYIKLAPVSVNSTCAGKKTKAIPTATWDQEVTACTAVGGAQCANGGVCAPVVLPPFNRFCVAQLGNVATCPAGYPNRELAHKAFSDSRKCDGTCTCSAFNNSNVKVYAGGGCGGAGTSKAATLGSPCYPTTFGSPPVDLSVKFFKSCSCLPDSLSMTGALQGVQPVTYCCTTP